MGIGSSSRIQGREKGRYEVQMATETGIGNAAPLMGSVIAVVETNLGSSDSPLPGQ